MMSAPMMPLLGCDVCSSERLRTVSWLLVAARPLLADALFSVIVCSQIGLFNACVAKAIDVYGFALRWMPPEVRCDNVLLELVVS